MRDRTALSLPQIFVIKAGTRCALKDCARTVTETTPPAHPRADRLRREASNCLNIAVRERDTAFTAQLIDEALRLAARARDLNTHGTAKIR